MIVPITISGGGLIGNYISRRLRRSGIESIIIEKNKPPQNKLDSIRTITLNPKSIELLEKEGINIASSSIQKIIASDGNSSGKIVFSSSDIGYSELSSVVMFDDLNKALQEGNLNNTLFETQINSIKYIHEDKLTSIELSSGSKIISEVLVACDGKNSNVAKLYNFENKAHSYNQTAATFLVQADSDITHAHQIFSEIGIFALMPAPKENIFTVVWSINNLHIENLDIKDFVIDNLKYFEDKLGHKMILSSKILNFELSNHYFKNYIKDSVVLMADSAHSIHPLAGQGVNLGFEDADIFCEKIEDAYSLGLKLNEPTFLKQYSIEREALNYLMLKSMDLFLDFFNLKNLYLRLIRGMGLNMVNKSKFLKTFFIKRASGK